MASKVLAIGGSAAQPGHDVLLCAHCPLRQATPFAEL